MISNRSCHRRRCLRSAMPQTCEHRQCCIHELGRSAGKQFSLIRGPSLSATPRIVFHTACTRTQRPWILTWSTEPSSRLWRRHCWRLCRPVGSYRPRSRESRPALLRTQRCLGQTRRTRAKGRAWERLLKWRFMARDIIAETAETGYQYWCSAIRFHDFTGNKRQKGKFCIV